jgi:hypothetical protein
VQGKLFYDTANDALVTAILSAGGYKKVSNALWPAKDEKTAYARLKACVDDAKHEKLEFDEVIAIARMAKEKRCHALMQYLASVLGYSIQEVTPEEQLASALTTFDATAGVLMDAISEVRRIQTLQVRR